MTSNKPKAAMLAIVIEGLARLAKTWGGHDVRSEPEEGEEGGDAGELVPGRELRIMELPVDQPIFDALVGDGAWNSFYNCEAGKIPEPAFGSFSKLKLDAKFKNSAVDIVFGVAKQAIRIDAATIKNISFRFKGAKPELSCAIVGARPRSIEVLDLEGFGGKPIDVRLALGALARDAEQQQALPLDQAQASSDAPPAKRGPGRPRKQSNAEHAIAH